MKIRSKVTVLIATLFAILGVAELLVARGVLLPSFTGLENAQADTAMRRIRYAMDLTLDQLELSATGWGNWTDTYRFAQDRNRAFIDENMTVIGIKQLNVNTLIIADVDGRFLTSGTIDLPSGKPLALDLAERQALPEGEPWRTSLREGRSIHGFVQTNRGILMVATAPILDGYGNGPARGAVIMGRLLSPDEIARIGDQVQAQLSMLARPRPDGPRRVAVSDSLMQVYHSFYDLYGHPSFTLRVDVPREITQRGYKAVFYASLYSLAAAVLMLMLLVTTLNRVILDPLARVTRHAVAIGEDRDLTTRLDFKGNDEIHVLAREFDRMVARVAESRSQLVDQSFHAGFAELAKGVLHNLGNAMTPIGVRLSILRTRLRETPADDVEFALAELERGNVDPARRPDLEEFIRLAGGQLAGTVKSVAEDVEVLSRQASIVQSGLSEQMRSTRNEHVIEAVRLPELLAQSLEVVPDSARQRLTVEADKSLQAVGVVNIPRTVMRLVLQNFIINAADSVRETGRSQGTFRISAQLTHETDTSRLYLCCTDNGAGISAENLGRLFEKGFSTKSKDTNFGIGLHWCANALGALGGRVWATSEGPGKGASMHVTVPLASREGLSIIKAA